MGLLRMWNMSILARAAGTKSQGGRPITQTQDSTAIASVAIEKAACTCGETARELQAQRHLAAKQRHRLRSWRSMY